MRTSIRFYNDREMPSVPSTSSGTVWNGSGTVWNGTGTVWNGTGTESSVVELVETTTTESTR